MKRFRFEFTLVACAASTFFLASCLIGPQSKRGTVVGNEARAGYVYKSDGSPAAAARIRVFPVDHVPDSTGEADSAGRDFSTTADKDGRYEIPALPEGEYNILSQLAGEYAIQDSIRLAEGTTIGKDTLRAPGALNGTVVLQPQHSPTAAVVQILGTPIYANVDEHGHFRLENLAAGRYTLKVAVSYPEYVSLFKAIKVITGKQDSLPDTLRPVFLGIPVATGLHAVYDTLNAVVSLSWDSTAYRDFSDYLIFRDLSPALELSKAAMGIVSSPAFSDTLTHGPNAVWSIADTAVGASKRLEYRVRIRNKSGDTGPAYGFVMVNAVSPASVRTRIQLKVESVVWDSTRQGDSITVRATISNPTRRLMSLEWSLGKADSTIAIDSLPGASSSQSSIRFLWSKQGSVTVYARVRDDAGTIWRDSLVLPGNSAPSLAGTPTGLALKGYQAFSFAPIAKDADRDSLVFCITNKPAWAAFDTRTGKLSGTQTNADTGSYAGIRIAVTDGRRTAVLSPFTLAISANPWSPKSNAPEAAVFPEAVTLGDLIMVTDENGNLFAYDPGKDSWTAKAPFPKGSISSFAAYEGKLFALLWTGIPLPPKTLDIYSFPESYRYDPVSDTWTRMPDPSGDTTKAFNLGFFPGCTVGGLHYVFDPAGVIAFDPASNSWSRMKAPEFSPKSDNPKCAVVDGKILTAGWEESSLFHWERTGGIVRFYDPAADAWRDVDSITPRIRTAMAAAGGKVYLAGGMVNPSAPVTSNKMEEFDPANGKWRTKTPMPIPTLSMSAAEWRGKLYFFEGTQNPSGNLFQGTNQVWEYDPALDR